MRKISGESGREFDKCQSQGEVAALIRDLPALDGVCGTLCAAVGEGFVMAVVMAER